MSNHFKLSNMLIFKAGWIAHAGKQNMMYWVFIPSLNTNMHDTHVCNVQLSHPNTLQLLSLMIFYIVLKVFLQQSRIQVDRFGDKLSQILAGCSCLDLGRFEPHRMVAMEGAKGGSE